MADKPQAKNELGQLFVDIGINGLGKTLKGLNSVAATFLLGKNAANQFVQSVAQPFKEMGNGAVQINKMSKALGTSTREFQRMYYYLKQYKSEDLLGDIEKVMEAIQDFNGSKGTVPEGWAFVQGSIKGGANALFEDLTPDLQGALKFIDRLKKGISDLDTNRQAWLLREAGLSSNFLHLWERGIDTNNYVSFSDEELDAQLKVQEALERLGINAQNFFNKFLTEFAPPIIKVANWLADKIKDAGDNNTPKKIADNVKDVAPGVAASLLVPGGLPVKAGLAIASKAANVVGREVQKSGGLYTGTPFGGLGYQYKGQTTGQAANITIINNNDIKGKNAEEIADAIIDKTDKDLEYSEYQVQNLAGR